MKPIIFLDIDGVLCTFGEYNRNRRKFWDKYDLAGTLRLPYEFNPKCVKVFNEILDETDADIVLSSDWRTHYNLQELDNIFKFNKVVKSPMDVTEVHPTSMSFLERNRGGEITMYLEKHPDITTYVIVDDLNLTKFVPEGHFVLTTEREGIKQSNVKQKVLKILGFEDTKTRNG
jgi:hypothetical protein